MVTTHMGFGFVFGYVLSLSAMRLFPGMSSVILTLSICFVLVGLAGGFVPDIDRYEQYGFNHRKTFHFPLGCGALAIVVTILGGLFPPILIASILGLCFFGGAWLHSSMDILDGFWANDINKGVYEHITRRWIRALNWIPFAERREWILLLVITLLGIGISSLLATMPWFLGSLVALFVFIALWLGTLYYEWPITAPKRWEMENRTLQELGLEPRHLRRATK